VIGDPSDRTITPEQATTIRCAFGDRQETMPCSPRKRNGTQLLKPAPETMRRAAVFDCVVTVKPSVTRCQRLALKGPDVIAQGFALGQATKRRMSPERPKYGPLLWADLAGRKSLRAMPPFQGGKQVGIGFPGLRPGLSPLAPSGPAVDCALNFMPSRVCEVDRWSTVLGGVSWLGQSECRMGTRGTHAHPV